MLIKVLRKVVVTIAGVILLILGFLGLFLPVLQGILFLTLGFILLSTEYHWVSRLWDKIKEKFNLGHHIKEANNKIVKLKYGNRRGKERS